MKTLSMRLIVLAMLAFMSLGALSQGTDNLRHFNGVVTDVLGNPIKRVKGYLHNPKIFSISDRHGRIGFSDVGENDTLHLVYQKTTYDIPLEGRRGMRIVLGDQLKVENDEKLVDIGYGFVKKREHTGASSGVTRAELMATGQTNLLEALKAKVPGLTITSSSAVESNKDVSIRGRSNIYGNSEPLYLVDGVQTDGLSGISISDVEYVEVIKDANMYGVRGANGVISVHTIR